VKVPGLPTVKVVAAPLVIAGAWSTVRANDWMASDPTPFDPVMVNGVVPPVPAAGVPANVAVPSVWSVNVTPSGNVAPPSERATAGPGAKPVVLTVKVPAWPTVNVVVAALVMAGP